MSKRIHLEESKSLLRFNFLNGGIDFDQDSYGAYAIATGCGAGKTTIIKELIKLKWYEGVLYSAFTIDEVNSMYQWIKEKMITTGIIKSDDIIVLHSDYTAEGTDNNLWRNNPQELMNKKIILCTHSKIVNEPIQLLIGSKFNSPSIFSYTRRTVSGIGSSIQPRKWILIDEGIEMSPISTKVNKGVIQALGELSFYRKVVKEEDGFVKFESEELPYPIMTRRVNSYLEFTTIAKYMSRTNPQMRLLFKDESVPLNKLRNIQLFDELYDNYEKYANLISNSDFVNVSYGLSSLSFDEGMRTHLLLFDGTSDITLRNSKKFKLLGYKNKYNGEFKLNTISFSLDRKLKFNKDTSDIESLLRSEMDKSVDKLTEIISKNTQTLIFCWKNFKMDNSEVNDDIDEYDGNIIKENKEFSLNKNFLLPEYLKFKLEEKGFTNGKEFSIEYYGSGKDKAINEYREYDAVILFGKYQVPSYVIDEFNLSYCSNISSSDYYTNRVIQAICRTRIRLHRNLPLNIYMSSDWSREVIDQVKDYLGIEDKSLNTLISKSGIDNDYMYNRLRERGVTPKKAEQIIKLSLYDSNVFNSIINEVQYTCRISLSEIFNIIPVSRKESDKYEKLKAWISNYGINLNIITPSRL